MLLADIIEYCNVDARLVHDLCVKLSAVQCIQQLSNVTYVPPSFVLERGQQIKVFSLVVRKARDMGYLCPSSAVPVTKAEGYEGAHVLPPVVGFYADPVVCVDFASLYPSIIIAHNLC